MQQRSDRKSSVEEKLVVVPDDDPPVMADSSALVRLKAYPGVRVRVHMSLPADEDDLRYRLARAHTAIFTRSAGHMTRSVMAGLHSLRHVVLTGAAAEVPDMEAARELGIQVTHTPDTVSDAVAEHTLALMLALARRVPELDQRVRAGEWPRGLITQLSGKTLGIVGTGVTGRKLARLAAGIGMSILAWSPDRIDEHVGQSRDVDLDYLLQNADVVSVHVRLSEAAGRMFGQRQFVLMKPTALFINTERAGLVDEAALAQALTSQTIAGAALDVFTQEPLPRESPLLGLPGVILSPHTAASTQEALQADLDAAVQNVIAFLEGRAADAALPSPERV